MKVEAFLRVPFGVRISISRLLRVATEPTQAAKKCCKVSPSGSGNLSSSFLVKAYDVHQRFVM